MLNEMKLKKYRVFYTIHTTAYVDVEAVDDSHAKEVAVNQIHEVVLPEDYAELELRDHSQITEVVQL